MRAPPVLAHSLCWHTSLHIYHAQQIVLSTGQQGTLTLSYCVAHSTFYPRLIVKLNQSSMYYNKIIWLLLLTHMT